MSYKRCLLLTPIILGVLVLIIYLVARGNEWARGTGNGGTSPSNGGSFIIAAYLANWAIADGFNISKLKPNQMTHINYAFANVNSNGSIVLGEPKADEANFKQLRSLKEKYRHLKVSLSVGGWGATLDGMASQESSRKQFTESVMRQIKTLGLDGIDIDWEYPKNEKDAENYVLLLKGLREALDDYQKKSNHSNDPFIVSVAVPAGPDEYKILKLKEMNQYVDIFYLMTYDLAGGFDSVTGYQSALYNKGRLDVDKAIKAYKDASIPSNKIVMGIPVYGRGFSNTENKIGAPFHGLPKGKDDDEGVIAYKYLPQSDAEEYYDDKKVASWSYDKNKKEFITYDNPQVVEAKCDYIQKNKLGGAMLWEISEDAEGKRSILDTIYNKIGSSMMKTNNHITF